MLAASLPSAKRVPWDARVIRVEVSHAEESTQRQASPERDPATTQDGIRVDVRSIPDHHLTAQAIDHVSIRRRVALGHRGVVRVHRFPQFQLARRRRSGSGSRNGGGVLDGRFATRRPS